MASKKNNPKSDPADLTLRVWVIEWRDRWKPYGKWRIYPDCIIDTPREDSPVWTCKNLAERFTDREFRYRAATLTFDDDGRKCVIY